MSIRYMEGYESIQMYRDLVARGAAPTTGAAGAVTSAGPARYAGGKSLVRGTVSLDSMTRRNLGPIGTGGGLALSFSGKLTSFNSAASNRIPIRYLGGKYVAPALAANPAALTIADDFRNWPAQQNITATSTGMLDVIFDTTRNEYVASCYTTSTTNQFFVSPTLTSTAWAATSGAMSGGINTSIGGYLYQDATSGILICIASSRIFTRKPGAAEAWNVAYDHGSAVFSGGAAFDGTRWIAPISNANQIVTSVDNGLTWVLSGTIANSVGTSIAATAGTIVIGRGGAQPFAVSKDGGVTFTLPGVQNPPASSGINVLYGNGVFVGIPLQGADNSVYLSTDGLTWRTYPFDRGGAGVSGASFANGYFFVAQSGPINWYSADGINWSVNESGSVTTIGNSTIGLQGPSNFYLGFGIGSDSTLAYRAPTGKGIVTVPSLGIIPKDVWNSYECALTQDSPTSFTYSISVGGIPVASNSFTWGLISDTGPRTFPAAGSGYGDYNGTVAVMPIANSGVMWTNDRGDTVTLTSIAGFGTCNKVLWTGTRFIAFTSGGFFASANGMTGWALIPGSPGASVQDADVNGNTIIAVGHASGAYYRSTDGGNTWTPVTTAGWGGYVYSGIAYLNGVWMAQPTWVASGQRDWKWSNDDGLTWQTISMFPSYIMGHASATDRVLFLTNVGTVTATVPVAGEAPVLTSLTGNGSTTPLNLYSATWSGKYFVASGQNAAAVWYSTDGATWGTSATSTNTGCSFSLGVNGAVLRYGGTSQNFCTIVYPEFTDMPITFSASATSFSAIDDVVVTDFLQPNAGPQGEVQIRLMPSDTDIQADWAKVPEEAPTNAAAATVLPISQSSGSYVEANDVGLKDKYGTSAFTYPAGLRPIAIQVEAFYERVFTNTPTVRLGLQAATNETQTQDITISSNLGQNTYVSKVVETNPDNGSGWSRETINDTKLTNEKTG